MDLLSALSHILDSFGFDEQASACRRLQESGSVAFKDESIQWQQWALDAEAKTGSTVSFQEYDLWARSRSTVLKIFDQLAMPMSITPPLMFDILGTTTESSGNSFTKARSVATRVIYSTVLYATKGCHGQPMNPNDTKVFEAVLPKLATSFVISESCSEVAAEACRVARACNPDEESWVHSTWSHAVSHVTWILRMLKLLSSGEFKSNSAHLHSFALWLTDHFDYAIAVVEGEIFLTAQEHSTCDMIRAVLKLCPFDSVAIVAAESSLSSFFDIVGPKLKNPLHSCVPYPLNCHFARAIVSSVFPQGQEADAMSFSQFAKAASSQVSRTIFGVHIVTLNAMFTDLFIKSCVSNPSVESLKKLTTMAPDTASSESSSNAYSVLADVTQGEWEVQMQSSARESASQMLLTLIANYRQALAVPGASTEKSVELLEEVVRAFCAWSPAADKWLQIAAAIEESQARLLDSKIEREQWGCNEAASDRPRRRSTVFQAVTFSSASSSKALKMHVSNLKDLMDCDKINMHDIPAFVDYAIKESCVDFDLFAPAIVDIALPNAAVEDKRQASFVGSKAIMFLVSQLCLQHLVATVGSNGIIDSEMVSACVALEAFEEFFVGKGVCAAAEAQVRLQLESVLEKTKRQVTIKFNSLFEGIVKAETFSNLSKVDGSSSSSNDMCALLESLTANFVQAKVAIDQRWWSVPAHVMINVVDRYIEFNAATGAIPSPVLPKVVHKSGALALFKSSDDKHVIPGGRRPSVFDFPEQAVSSPEGTTLWGPKSEHKRLTDQRLEELVARYCNMEKVAEFLSSLDSNLRQISLKSDAEFDQLPMAIEINKLMGTVQSRKKFILTYLSHKLVLFDLYEPLVDRLFAPDPSQKNPVARPFRITPLLAEFVDPLLGKLASYLPPLFSFAIFKAIYAAVLVAFDRSVFNGGDHKCLDKTDIITGDLNEIRLYFFEGLKSAGIHMQLIDKALDTPHFLWLKSTLEDLFALPSATLVQIYKDGAAVESSPADSSPRVSYFIFRVLMHRKDKADSHADSFRSKVMGSKQMRDVARSLKRPPATIFW